MITARQLVLSSLLSIVLAVGSAASASAEVIIQLDPGAEAPPIELDALLGAAGGAGDGSASALVVEFWATWCAPCVEAIPHWNELVATFAGEDVVFLSITDEDEGKVSAFLEDRPIAGWVGIDGDRSTFAGFGVTSLPATFLVGRDGRIAAVTDPDLLTEDAIRDLLRGRAPRLEPRWAWGMTVVETGEYRPDGEWPPTELRVADAELDTPSWTAFPEMVVADGVDPRTAIAIAFDLHPRQVEVNPAVSSRRLQLVASDHGASAGELRRRLREPLLAELGVGVREERRTLRVAVLRDLPAEGGRLRRAGSERPFVLSRSPSDTADARPLGDLVARLRDLLDLPIVDESGLGGLWDWRIEWPLLGPSGAGNHEPVAETVRKQLGLELAFEEREVRVLVVGPTA